MTESRQLSDRLGLGTNLCDQTLNGDEPDKAVGSSGKERFAALFATPGCRVELRKQRDTGCPYRASGPDHLGLASLGVAPDESHAIRRDSLSVKKVGQCHRWDVDNSADMEQACKARFPVWAADLGSATIDGRQNHLDAVAGHADRSLDAGHPRRQVIVGDVAAEDSKNLGH